MSIAVKIEAQYEEFLSATKLMGQLFGGVMDGMKTELKAMSDQAKADMKGHESATEQFANIVKNSMKGVTGAVEGVKIAWAQLGVILAAGAFLKETVTETVKMTVEAQKLGRVLGTSATQASYLKVAINDAHGTTDQYIQIAKGLDTQLKKNEKAMNGFGLETRDSGGHLKDQQTLVMDALETLRGYKEGTDRNIAAQQLFGKGVNVSSELLTLNAEKLAAAKEKADALGLAVGSDDVEASNKFRAAMNDMHDIIDAVMKAIGSALLPVLNDLAEWFSQYGPTAILAIKASLDIVITAFKGVALAVKELWEFVKLAFNNMVTIGRGFAEVFVALFHGDFQGAKDAASAAFNGLASNAGEAMQRIMDNATSTRDSLASMWSGTFNRGPAKDSGTESGGTEDADVSKKGKKGKDHSAEEARKAAAEKRRLLKEEYDATMEAYRGEEQAARDNLGKILEIQKKELASAVAMYGAKSKQAEQAANRIAETERKIADQLERLDLKRAEAHRNVQKMMIDVDQREAEARVQMGQLTVQQLITLERGYEDQRYALDRQSLIEEAAANIERVEDHQATLLKLEELDQAHAGRVAAIKTQAAVQAAQTSKQVEGVMASSFSNAITGMINKTMTFGQALRSVFSSILQGVVQMLAQWAAKQAAHYILVRLMHVASATAKAGIEKASASKSITTAAAVAGANGVASFADAPWPVDMGAPQFGADMARAAGSYGAGLAAEQGFDVPAGMNPVTQLHQKEMVLPATQAQVIRDMADGGGRAGGDTHIQVNALDMRSLSEALRRNPAALGEAVQYAHRMGHVGMQA